MDDIWGKGRKGKLITIKTACYRTVDNELLYFRRKIAHNRQIDLCHNKHNIPDPRDCFADKDEDYAKADALIEKLHLTEPEIQTINCYMNGMRQGEVCAELGIGRGTINHRKASIRQRYYSFYGAL